MLTNQEIAEGLKRIPNGVKITQANYEELIQKYNLLYKEKLDKIEKEEEKMNEDIFAKGIGNKEGAKSLQAKPVVVQGKKAEPVYKKGTKEEEKAKAKPVGHKLVLLCKHPDKDELIKISEMVFVAGKTLKTSTIWINIDDEGNIQKGSIIATLLEKYKAPNVNALEGMTLQTELDENRFLAIKAY